MRGHDGGGRFRQSMSRSNFCARLRYSALVCSNGAKGSPARRWRICRPIQHISRKRSRQYRPGEFMATRVTLARLNASTVAMSGLIRLAWLSPRLSTAASKVLCHQGTIRLAKGLPSTNIFSSALVPHTVRDSKSSIL
jgi:hypothetical protein